MITTSRRPTDLIRSMCRDLSNSIPNLIRINRGKMSLDQVTEKALELDADRVVLVDRWKMGTGKISLYIIDSSQLTIFPPELFLSKIQLKRNFENKIRDHVPIITIEPNNLHKIEKLAQSFSEFFNLPIIKINEAPNRQLSSMHISYHSKGYIQIKFILLGSMIEIGPRITVSNQIWGA